MLRKYALASLAALAILPVVKAQNPSNTANRSGVSDPLFAAAAASSGLAEVTISKLGQGRATDNDLKQFSQRMLDEHTKANRELMELAARKGFTLPNAPGVCAQFCAESLNGLSGEEFDRCYAKAQLTAHMEAVAMFEAESQRGLDPDVKAWATRTLPHLKDHLKTIKPIAMKFEKERPSTEGAAEHQSK